MKTLKCQARTKANNSMLQGQLACKPLTKIVMESQDLLRNRIVLSVLTNREVVKLSPEQLLANSDILNRLSQKEAARVTYLLSVQQMETSTPVKRNANVSAKVNKPLVTKIMIENQNLLTGQMILTLLFNRDLIKLPPYILMTRHDILRGLDKRDFERVMYLAGVEFGELKARAEALIAEKVA